MIKIKTINKTIYPILIAFIFCMFNHSSGISTDINTNSTARNILQKIINKLFYIQIFILDQIDEFKDCIQKIKNEYNHVTDEKNKDKFSYIDIELDDLSKDALKKTDLDQDTKSKIKLILAIKKIIRENTCNKESLSKYLQILRNEMIYSVLTKYFTNLQKKLNELNEYLETPEDEIPREDILIIIPKINTDKDIMHKLFIIDSDDIKFISSKRGFYRNIFNYPFISYMKDSHLVQYNSNRQFTSKEQEINDKILLCKINAKKLFDKQTKGLNKFSKELYDLINELTPRQVDFDGQRDYKFHRDWPKPQKEDYKALGIVVPNFLKYQNS